MTPLFNQSRSNQGFTLIEMLVAVGITVVVLASVFQLLYRGQESFRREPEVAEMTANARAGLDMISRDLGNAGLSSPPTMSIAWADGGGITPDELTIIFADADVPTSEPMCTGNGNGCGNLKNGSTLWIDKDTFVPPVADPAAVYHDGQVLFALETEDCNNDGMSIIPFTLTKEPKMSGGKLHLQHNPKGQYNTNKGFNDQVQEGCAVIGVFHVIQYRINPLPPADNPALERRDIGLGEDWTPVAANIENLQFQYGQGTAQLFEDVPGLASDADDPNSWITGVRISVSGRSASTNLAGGTAGVFAAEDTHLRKTFSTSVILRNQLGKAAVWAEENDVVGWN